jgi:hypothetical protein
MRAMIRWTWDASAPGAQGRGVSDGEVEARAAAANSSKHIALSLRSV